MVFRIKMMAAVSSKTLVFAKLHAIVFLKTRGSVRSTRGLGPTMTVQGQSIGILIGMLPCDLVHEFSFFIIHNIFSFWGNMKAIMVQDIFKYYTMEFDLQEGF
jgi:hypothetical protein